MYKRQVELIDAAPLGLGGKIGHQLCTRRALGHVGEIFVEPQVLLCQFVQQVAEMCIRDRELATELIVLDKAAQPALESSAGYNRHILISFLINTIAYH